MLNVTVSGDVCARGHEDTLNYAAARALLADMLPVLESADVRIVNWENPTTDTEGFPISKSGAMLHSKPQNVEFLKAGGFDVALQANNHTGDYGPDGTMATIRYLDKIGVKHAGAGANLKEARLPAYVQANGETLAVISACEYEFGIAGRDIPGAAGYDAREMRKTITDAHQKADYVLVVFHGGNERNPLPSPRCAARYRDIIDMGADALVGMHSHCPQGYEVYNGKPIIYGLGNFMFHTLSDSTLQDNPWHYGYTVKLKFCKDSNAEFELYPYQFNKETSVLRLMKGRDREKMLTYLAAISEPIQDEIEHEKLFYGWCMIGGPGYAKALRYSDDYLVNPENEQLLAARNLFTCEAHNELLTVYLRMMVEGTLTLGAEYEQKVRQLQIMPVNVW